MTRKLGRTSAKAERRVDDLAASALDRLTSSGAPAEGPSPTAACSEPDAKLREAAEKMPPPAVSEPNTVALGERLSDGKAIVPADLLLRYQPPAATTALGISTLWASVPAINAVISSSSRRGASRTEKLATSQCIACGSAYSPQLPAPSAALHMWGHTCGQGRGYVPAHLTADNLLAGGPLLELRFCTLT